MAMAEACVEEAVCYLCLDGGVDKADQSLRRDCACRGTDAGFFHLSCLTEYAAAKSKGCDGRDMNEFRDPWLNCPYCHQYYQNELAIDIASEFALFVRGQYPDDTERQVEALYLKLRALNSMLYRLQPVQKKEAGVIADVLLSLIDRMKNDAPLAYRYSQMEAHAYNTHGLLALHEGSEESARRAVVHFEKSLQVVEAIGDDDGIATAKRNIAIARSKYDDDGSNNEEVLKASQEMYELRLAQSGDNNEYTIIAGKSYAFNLQKANRWGEARELLMKLLATSKQVFGSDHSITKGIEATLKQELLKELQKRYELRVAELDEEIELKIDAGKIFAIDLQKANRREEARELLMKLLATSKHIFGSDHNITKSVESML
jgi:hypothetical protein